MDNNTSALAKLALANILRGIELVDKHNAGHLTLNTITLTVRDSHTGTHAVYARATMRLIAFSGANLSDLEMDRMVEQANAGNNGPGPVETSQGNPHPYDIVFDPHNKVNPVKRVEPPTPCTGCE